MSRETVRSRRIRSTTASSSNRRALKAVFYATIILVAAGTVGQVIETRSLPRLTRSYPRRFTFYVAFPKRSIPSTAKYSMSLDPSAPFACRLS